MAITLFGIASCDSCRNARRWLEAAGLDYRYHDLRKDGLPETALRAWVRRAGWDAVLNRRSATWRRIPEVDRAVDGPEAAMELMKEYPTIIKRPILSSGRVLIIGFDPDEYSDKLSASGS
jgi:Spx/MgsR family transcriptional regulator